MDGDTIFLFSYCQGPASLTDTLNTLQTILNGVPIAGGGVGIYQFSKK